MVDKVHVHEKRVRSSIECVTIICKTKWKMNYVFRVVIRATKGLGSFINCQLGSFWGARHSSGDPHSFVTTTRNRGTLTPHHDAIELFGHETEPEFFATGGYQ